MRTENASPPLVERELFLTVQSLLRDRMPVKVHPRRTSSPFMLSGLLLCGHCGRALSGKYAKRGRYGYYTYGTLDKQGRGSCKAGYTWKEKLEQAVISKIKEHVLTYEHLKELVHLVNEEMDLATNGYQKHLNVISVEIDSVNQRLERLYDALETGSLKVADLAPRIQRLRQHHEQLNAARLELEGQLSDRKVELADIETVKNCVEDLRNMLEDSLITERKSFIKSFVREVRVIGSEVSLRYSSPLLPGMMSRETLLVPPIVRDGGPWATVPELLFEKKGLIPALQQMLVLKD